MGWEISENVIQPHVVHTVRSFTSGACSPYQWKGYGSLGSYGAVHYNAFFVIISYKDGESLLNGLLSYRRLHISAPGGTSLPFYIPIYNQTAFTRSNQGCAETPCSMFQTALDDLTSSAAPHLHDLWNNLFFTIWAASVESSLQTHLLSK